MWADKDPRCQCRQVCGDLPEDQDHPLAVCKGLKRPPVEVVLVPKREEN